MNSPTIIEPGVVASFHYTLTAEDGDIIDSSEGRDPLAYLHGGGNIVPGLERQLAGLRVGDTLRAVVEPVDGYGERSERPMQKVPRSAFPPDAQVFMGMQLLVEGPNGEPIPVWVAHVAPEFIAIDFNHPLAGVRLTFDVQVTAVRAATAAEMQHGHPHGADGHDHSHGHE